MPISIYGDGSIGPLSATEVGYLDGLTSAVQTQLNGKGSASTGTFTPTMYGSTTAGTATYSVQVGRYAKVGSIVLVSIGLTWSGHTGAGSMRIDLPFTAGGTSSYVWYGIADCTNMTLPASSIPTCWVVGTTGYTTLGYQVAGTGTQQALSFDAAAQLYLSLMYEAA